MRCAGCGYPDAVHEIGTLKCPQETADKNGRRGKFRAPEDVPRRDWHGLSIPLTDAEIKAAVVRATGAAPVTTGPPQVPARPPLSPGEFAGGSGNKQATKLGRHAIAGEWSVVPLYWRAHDGAEGCGVWLARDDLRALATWKRPPGGVGKLTGWAADLAYAWRTGAGRAPTKLNHTDLERLISDSTTRPGDPAEDHKAADAG
jgi:hypothetical protein